MRYARATLAVLLTALFVFITGCSTTLSGTYLARYPEVSSYDNFTFNSDGTGSVADLGSSTDITYEISNGMLHIEFDSGDDLFNDLGNTIVPDFSFSQRGNSIFIAEQEYVRQS